MRTFCKLQECVFMFVFLSVLYTNDSFCQTSKSYFSGKWIPIPEKCQAGESNLPLSYEITINGNELNVTEEMAADGEKKQVVSKYQLDGIARPEDNSDYDVSTSAKISEDGTKITVFSEISDDYGPLGSGTILFQIINNELQVNISNDSGLAILLVFRKL